jgi:hypothetical protein
MRNKVSTSPLKCEVPVERLSLSSNKSSSTEVGRSEFASNGSMYSPGQQMDEGYDDSGDDFEVREPPSFPRAESSHSRSSRIGSGRIGLEDKAVFIERLTDLLDDIFEADDNLVPDTAEEVPATPSGDQLPAIFLAGSINSDRALLAPSALYSIIKMFTQAQRAAIVNEVNDSTSDINAGQLARLLKILERSIKVAEDKVVIPEELVRKRSSQAGEEPSKQKQPKGKKGRQKSSVVDTGDAEMEAADEENSGVGPNGTPRSSRSPTRGVFDEQATNVDWTDESFALFEENLRLLLNALLACDACLTIMTCGKLPKQVWSPSFL